DAVVRFAPGAAEAALGALASGDGDDSVRAAASLLRDAGPVVILWSERLSYGERGRQTVAALLALARALDLAGTDGAGLIEVPLGTNSRGLREVGCVPNMAPGLGDLEAAGKSAPEIAAAMGGELSALVLFHADPVRTHPDRAAWERALDAAGFVLAFSDFVTESLEEHASVVFPAEAYAEKEGTVTHPDGRLQRLRQAVGRPGSVRTEWSVLLELASELTGAPLSLLTESMVTRALSMSVPFYAGITLEEIGGRGVRWQERDAASKLPSAELP